MKIAILIGGFFLFFFIYEKEGFETDLAKELPVMVLFLGLFLLSPYSLYLGIFAVLIMSAVLDYEEGIISDATSITALLYGLSIAYFSGRLLISAGVFILVLFFFLVFSFVYDGIGGGDIKFIAALTPGFPPIYALYFIIASLSFGILSFPFLKKKTGRFPLGPAILFGYLLIFFVLLV